jgi:hypothetical protein
MRVYSQVRYYPQSAVSEFGPRSQSYWDAFKHAIAVKKLTVNGYYTFPRVGTNGATSLTTINQANVEKSRSLFAQWTKKKLSEIGINKPVLVPIPSSRDGIIGAQTYRTLKLAETVAAAIDGARVAPILRFITPIDPGNRSIDDLCKKMVHTGVPFSDIVLIDDIKTSGSHLLAAQRIFNSIGSDVLCAITCGATTRSQDENAFTEISEDIQDYSSLFKFLIG